MDALTTDTVRTQLQQVLDALEAMTPDNAAKPLKALAHPARMLAQGRNAVIAARHADEQVGPPDLLQRMNQCASVMASLEYPLGGVHWKRIESLRKALRALIREMGAG